MGENVNMCCFDLLFFLLEEGDLKDDNDEDGFLFFFVELNDDCEDIFFSSEPLEYL